MSITKKLFISYFLVSVISTVSISYLYFKSSKKAIIERTLNQLTSVKNLKKGWIEDYFNHQKQELTFFASIPELKTTFRALNDSFKKINKNKSVHIAADSTLGNLLNQFKLSHKYINVWFINSELDVIYTVNKSTYPQINLKENKSINPIFLQTVVNGLDSITIKDISYISTDNRLPYIIITTPISDEEGLKLGLVLVKIDIKEINNILVQRTGLGNTGESYVVNSEMTLRSQSRFIDKEEKTIVNTVATQKAFSGVNDKMILEDYRGVTVLSSFVKIDIPGIDWALVSEIDFDEAMLPINKLRNEMILINILVCIFVLGITAYFSNFFNQLLQKQNIIKSSALLEGQENERKRISRDLHDGIGQMLTAVKFKSQEIANSQPSRELNTLVDETIQEVRKISNNLMPSVLLDFGLDAALKLLVKNIAHKVNYSYYKAHQVPELSIEYRIGIYRVIQEALNNASKYAQTTETKLDIVHEPTNIKFTVKDCGVGFDFQTYKKNNYSLGSHGLQNMEERIYLLGGKLIINSAVGKGTEIVAQIFFKKI